MTLADWIMVIAAAALGVLLLSPPLQRFQFWRATVTPLASIIGSGFLVAGPILAHAAGRLATLTMFGLCAIGYLYGAAVRHNIIHVEPQLDTEDAVAIRRIEYCSDLALSLAYFVSVAYYLNLFSAFGLRGLGVTSPFATRIVATCVIAAVGALGFRRGLDGLERVEILSVGFKLSLIGGLSLALVGVTLSQVNAGEFGWPLLAHARGVEELQILLGLVILVQGFETSRYLGAKYPPQTRVASMRTAQLVSTLIYVVFLLLVTAYFPENAPVVGSETAIIDMLAPLGTAVAPLLIAMALASQLSAAVADTNGAGGLVSETSGRKIAVRTGYAITAGAAIAVTWAANIYEIITYASKAFVLYYGLQSLQAALSARRLGQGRERVKAVVFGFGVIMAVTIIVFAVPAEA